MALVITRIEQNYKLIPEKSLVSLAVSQYDTDTVGFVHVELRFWVSVAIVKATAMSRWRGEGKFHPRHPSF